MAKENGLGWTGMSIDDSGGTLRDIRNDLTNIQFATPRAEQNVTGIDRSAMERILNLADMSFTGNGVFNDASNMSHDVFKTVPSTSVAREFSLNVSGQILGTAPTCTLLFTDYALTRGDDGALTFSVPGVLANGAVPTWTT
ncbi:hypothetical protein O3Q52_17440 [Streptomyces sp. ActVer]|uniref:hypothetical protein n=1 Tax=Streptomyces sp. ActVer TaxID=3014558 RepID=UPI0022B39AE7|nr:hypothetical protein [Streptomyces sp. ActVer]MCZ4509949.1 hypothetical protein [Streptomyces sp. ActVer]